MEQDSMGRLLTLLLVVVCRLSLSAASEQLTRNERRSEAGPVTLLVHGKKVGRSNENNNNTSNIHDYFRHVFIRKNQTNDITDHPATPDETTPANGKPGNGTKSSTKKKERKTPKIVTVKPPNISNIHDFFRHVFIRKNATNAASGGPAAVSEYLPTPGTVGAYDVAHGKVKNVHRKQRVLAQKKGEHKEHKIHKKKKLRMKVKKVQKVPPKVQKVQKVPSKVQKVEKVQRKVHRKKVKSHASINSRVLITPTKSSHESAEITLKVAPLPTAKTSHSEKMGHNVKMGHNEDPSDKESESDKVSESEKENDSDQSDVDIVDEKKVSQIDKTSQSAEMDHTTELTTDQEAGANDKMVATEEEPENMVEKVAYQNSQLLRSDEVIEPTAMNPLATDDLVPTYTAMQPVYNNVNNNNNLGGPTPSRIRWLFNNQMPPTNANIQPVKNVAPPLSFLQQMRVRAARIGSASLRHGPLLPTSGLPNYLKNNHIAPPARLSMQPLLQENVGYAFDEGPTIASINPLNAKIIHGRNLADISSTRIKSRFNPADKKNLVQFRDHNGKVIATLRDPHTWNNANVTLSKADDGRRFMNDWRAMQAEGGLKRGVTNTGKALPGVYQIAMARTLTPQDILNEFTPHKSPLIPRKIAITPSNSSAPAAAPIGPKTRTDADGDRVISFHAYKAPLIPVKREGVRAGALLGTPALGVPKNVYDIGDVIITKRNFIFPKPTLLPSALKRQNVDSNEMITAINGIEQPTAGYGAREEKRTFKTEEDKNEEDKENVLDDDPWKEMEGNILDDKDRAYLVELLSNLGGPLGSVTRGERVGIRRDDIPGGKNNHQILTKVTKFMGDVEKFIKNVEIISSTFGKDKQIPSKLIKFIVHVEKFIDDIENITTSFGKGPVKRKQESKDFLAKLQKLVAEQTSNGQSLFDLFQSNASLTLQPNKTMNMTGNLYKETVDFLKDEIEEIEQVRNMLKAEDDRLGNITAGTDTRTNMTEEHPKDAVQSNKPVVMDMIETESGFEVFNKVLQQNSPTPDADTDKSKHDTSDTGETFLMDLNAADNSDKGKKSNESKVKEDDSAGEKEDPKSIDMSSIIPVESTAANPDEAQRERKFTSSGKEHKDDDGTVFSPIIPEEEDKKNVTFAITPAKLTEGMTSSPTARIDQIVGVREQPQPVVKNDDVKPKPAVGKSDVDDDDDAELSKTTADEIKKDEKIEDVNLLEANNTSTKVTSEAKGGTRKLDKETHSTTQENKQANLHEDVDGSKDNDTGTDSGIESGTESPMIITPKLFKESIHEAIRQFAQRMKLGAPGLDSNADPLLDIKDNRIEKSMIQAHLNVTEDDPFITGDGQDSDGSRNETTDKKNVTGGGAEGENKNESVANSNTTTSRLSRLVQFFLSSKQAGGNSKHNASRLIDEISMAVKADASVSQLEALESVRKSFFGGQRDENGEEASPEPVLSVAAHYAPKISYESLQMFPDTNKKSLTMRQRAKLSAATPYDHKKDEKDEPLSALLQNNQTTEYLNNISREMTSAVESAPLVPAKVSSNGPSEAPLNAIAEPLSKVISEAPLKAIAEAPSKAIVEAPLKAIADTPSQAIVEAPLKVISDAPSQAIVEAPLKAIAEPLLKAVADAPPQSTSNISNVLLVLQRPSNNTTPITTPSITESPLNSTGVNVNVSNTPIQPFIFPYTSEMSRYDTPCVHTCLDGGTVLGMCVRECDVSPVRRHVKRKSGNKTGSSKVKKRDKAVPAPVRSIHLSQPEPYAPESDPPPDPSPDPVPPMDPVPPSLHEQQNNTKSAQPSPIRQFIDEEGNIMEQNQDQVTTTFKLTDNDTESMSPVLTQSAKFDNTNEKSEGDDEKKENKNDPESDDRGGNPTLKINPGPDANVADNPSQEENDTSAVTMENDLYKAGLLSNDSSNGSDDNKKKKYYCQDKPCFSLKDIWKMLHCDHPPCYNGIFNPRPSSQPSKFFSNHTTSLESEAQQLAEVESPENLLTKARYNRILAQQKMALKEPLVPETEDFVGGLAVTKIPPYTDADELDKYGPLAPEKFAPIDAKFAPIDADTMLDGPNANIPGFTGTPDAVTNKIPALAAVTNKIPELAAVTNKIPELAAVTNKIPVLAGVTNKIPVLAGVTNKIPVLAAVTNKIPELAAVTNKIPELAAVTNKIPELAAVTNKMPDLATITNKIPELAGATAITDKIPEFAAINKITELAGVTDVEKLAVGNMIHEKSNKLPAFAGFTDVPHEITTKFAGLAGAPDVTHEITNKIPAFVSAANVNPNIPNLNKCPCPHELDSNCQRRCLGKQKQQAATLQALKAKHKIAAHEANEAMKKPIVVMIKPNIGLRKKHPADHNQTFTSRVCRSWTYFPYFTCLLESPISRPYLKPKSPPFDGPYENCRTLPTFPFFKCYSNGLSEVLPAQRHKITKQVPRQSKARNVAKGGKQAKRPSAINIQNKMSDAVAKAMLENANRANANKNKARLSKPNANSPPNSPPFPVGKSKRKEQVKKSPKRVPPLANKQKTPPKVRPGKAPLPASLVTQLEAGKRILHKATTAPILPIKKSTPIKNMAVRGKPARPGLFNIKYMLTLAPNKLFVPYKGGIAPNTFTKTNLIKPFSSLDSSSKGPHKVAPPLPQTPKRANVRANVRARAPPPPRRRPVMANVVASRRTPAPKKAPKKVPPPRKTARDNDTSPHFPPWFNPKTNFNGYINALLAQHKVKEAELFKKILRVIMSSPKSRKYNEAGGDPWKYIYPALKWVEEYENVWKPKFKGARGEERRTKNDAADTTKKKKVKKTIVAKKQEKMGTKKAIVPGISGVSIANQLYNSGNMNDDKKYVFQEEPSLSLDNLADDEEMQSLGFTTGENTEFTKDMYLK